MSPLELSKLRAVAAAATTTTKKSSPEYHHRDVCLFICLLVCLSFSFRFVRSSVISFIFFFSCAIMNSSDATACIHSSAISDGLCACVCVCSDAAATAVSVFKIENKLAHN